MKRLLLLIAIIFTGFTSSYASHLMGGEITYTHVSGNDYEVTLIIYRDCSGITVSQNATVVFESASCGQNINFSIPFIQINDVSQVCPGQTTTCNGGTVPGTQQYVFRGIVTLTPCSDWIMRWNSGTRNPNITNLVNPGSQNLYIQNTLNNIIGTNNNSPQYFNLPTPYLCANNLAIYSHAASDADGDSLYYSLNTPLTTPGPPGTPIAFMGGYSLLQPMITAAGMNLNQTTGEMCFTPSQAQTSVVSILIQEYRNGVLIGTQIREMQVIVTTCTNQNPSTGVTATCGGAGGMTIPVAGLSVDSLDQNSVMMCPNDNVCLQVVFSDPDGDNITVTTNVALAIPGATWTVANNNTPNPIGTFCWTPTALDSGLNVFAVILTDDACPISGTQTFTYDITVFDEPYAGPDDTICQTQSTQLNASGGATYTWFDVATNTQMPVGPDFSCNPCFNPIVTPLVTTSYYVLSSLTAACENTDSVTIEVVADFTPDAIGDTILCDYLNRPLDVVIAAGAATGYTYLWNNAGTLNNPAIQNPVASPTVSTWYVVDVTSNLGCTRTDSAFVQVTPPPNVQLVPGDSTICQGDVLTFGVESSCNYTLEMFDTFGDAWNGQSLDIFENGVLIGNFGYVGPCCTSTFQSVTFPVTNGSTITVVYNTGGFQIESSFNIIDGTGTIVSAYATGSMTGLNTGDNLYTGIGNCGPSLGTYSFSWAPAADLSNALIADPVLTANTLLGLTTYTVTLTDAVSGCAIDRTQDITVVPGYTLASTQNDTDICVGDVINFATTATPAGAYTYAWTSNTGVLGTPTMANTTGTFNTVGPDTVIVTVDNNGAGCIRTDTMFVNVSAVPNISITTPATILSCTNSIALAVNLGGAPVPNNFSFDWNFGSTLNDSTIQNPIATPNDSVYNYQVIVTDTLGGCSDVAFVEIRSCCITPIVTFTDVTCNGLNDGKIVASATTLYNSTLTFEFYDMASTLLQTSTGNLADSILTLGPGNYTVVISDAIGCSYTQNITIIEPAPVVLSNVTPDTTICINGTATLYGTGSGGIAPVDLIWNGGLIGNGPHNVNPTTISNYSVFAQDASGCVSPTQNILVDFFPPITINSIEALRDTVCRGDTTTLKVQAIGGGTDLIYTWYNGGGLILGATAASTFIVTPTYDGELFSVIVSDSCTTPTQTESIPVYWPVVTFPTYTVSDIEGCFDQIFPEIINTTTNLNDMSSVFWDFGDGDTSSFPFATPIVHSYDNPGIYNITLTLTDKIGCVWDTVIGNFQIKAHDYPHADFLWNPNPTDYLNAEITFDNQSVDNAFNEWVFITNAQNSSNDIDPVFQFPQHEPGNYDVTLKVTNEFGCQDSISKIVVIDDVFLFYIPTAFTPDGDGLNDEFRVVGEGLDLSSYKMTIFNKWGELIFESSNPDVGWDGTYKGDPVKDGVYIWKINAKEAHSPIIHYNDGFITIVR